jgi:hypothetical protein
VPPVRFILILTAIFFPFFDLSGSAGSLTHNAGKGDLILPYITLQKSIN